MNDKFDIVCDQVLHLQMHKLDKKVFQERDHRLENELREFDIKLDK